MADMPIDHKENQGQFDQTNIEAKAERCLFGLAIGQFTISINIGHRDAYEKLLAYMPPRCHPQLDSILSSTDIAAPDLLRACQGRYLQCKDGRLVREWVASTYIFSSVLLCFFVVVELAFGWAFATLHLTSYQQGFCFFFVAICTASIVALIRQFYYPQHVAGLALRSKKDEVFHQ